MNNIPRFVLTQWKRFSYACTDVHRLLLQEEDDESETDERNEERKKKFRKKKCCKNEDENMYEMNRAHMIHECNSNNMIHTLRFVMFPIFLPQSLITFSSCFAHG